ncbi:uncharacterized protein K02A2.6-like [Lucilia sericata]|uniref:uncharacterized protein K02A2.6-like n=1 Tax=Lucilia sericata TaxID=13632 RepID=UPI0018A81920|nr:uncharacterized protein K02A2.6-like [Lucilia sericata]
MKSYFLSWMGQDLFELASKLFGTEKLQTKTFQEIICKLEQYYASKVHVVVARFKFHNRLMQEGESYAKWLLELKGLSRNCSFTCKNCQMEYVDEMIRDALILNTSHEIVRTAALQKQNPSLEEVINIAETYESTQSSLETIRNNSLPQEVQQVKFRNHNPKYQQQNNQTSKRPSKISPENQLPSCSGCFKNHKKQNCKFRNAKCHRCGKTGHIAPVCKSKNVNNIENSEKLVSDSEHCHQMNNLLIRKDKKLLVNVQVNEHKLEFQFDTGASCSMIDLKSYNLFKKLPIYKTDIVLRAYGNQNIPVLGMLKVDVSLGSETKPLKLLVANTNEGSNIFGIDWYDAFKCVNDIFQLESCCNMFKAHLYLKENAIPKFSKAIPIPFALQEQFKEEAKRLEEFGIPKPDSKIRICADFKQTVNPQLDMEQYPIPKLEDLLHKLRGGCKYSKINLSDTYFQIAMDEESKKILVVNTPLGLFQYQKLPFDVSSAPEIFQRFLQQLISDIPNTFNYLDDIVVTGKTHEEHEQNLEKLLLKLENAGLTCNIACRKLKILPLMRHFLGAVISHVYPDGSERPIAHASKTLNAHQKNYSQIEMEALAIIFGVKKFHEYLYGRKFTLIADHKPLVSIFNPQKSIPIHSANRIQQWALFLSNYNFDIKYKSTNNHQNADALSRLPLESDTEIDIELDKMDIYLAEEIC